MRTLDAVQNNLHTLLWTAVAVVFVSLMVYGYFVNQAVLHVVERRDLTASITHLESEVSALESRYIATRAGVTQEQAYARGFSAPRAVDYVTAGDGIDVALLTQ